MIRVALVGCGHMGAHHARVVGSHPECQLVATVDLDRSRAERLATRFGGRAVRVVPAQVDAVIVATPASTHAAVSGPVLERGTWCLVEKPMAATAAEAARIASDRLVVGHSERFNPAVRALGAVRPERMRAARCGPSSPRGTDVDVVVDRMAHDLDLALWWGQGPSEVIEARREGGDGVYARVRVGRADVELRASRSSAGQVRTLDLEGPGGPWSVDLLRGTSTRAGQTLVPPDARDALEVQWGAFLRTMGGARPEGADAAAGLAVLDLAERIRDRILVTSGR